MKNDDSSRGAVTPGASILRCTAVWLCTSFTLAPLSALFAATAHHAWSTDNPLDPQQPLLALCAMAGLAACPPLWWSITSVCWRTARGLRVTPAGLVRRLTLLACGVTLSVSVAAPSFASALGGLDGLPHPELPSVGTVTATPTPALPDSSAPQDSPPPTTAPPTARRTSSNPVPHEAAAQRPVENHRQEKSAPARTHTVVAGDSLWRIAEHHVLTPQPSASPQIPARVIDVAAAVRALHRANHGLIGDDPNLIHPGYVLTLPSATDQQEQR